MLTENKVLKQVKSVVKDIINDYKTEPETDRETVIERLDEERDSLWGNLVEEGPINLWDVTDLANYAGECAAIIKTAENNAWVENDQGLWEGMTYGVLPSIAYFSLRNLLYQVLKDEGHDTNARYPFAVLGSLPSFIR